MIKYIIKNCDCSVTTENICAANERLCKDVDNCLLKNIVKICDSSVSKVLYEGESLKLIEGNKLASDILKLLDIEEVDE